MVTRLFLSIVVVSVLCIVWSFVVSGVFFFFLSNSWPENSQYASSWSVFDGLTVSSWAG